MQQQRTLCYDGAVIARAKFLAVGMELSFLAAQRLALVQLSEFLVQNNKQEDSLGCTLIRMFWQWALCLSSYALSSQPTRDTHLHHMHVKLLHLDSTSTDIQGNYHGRNAAQLAWIGT